MNGLNKEKFEEFVTCDSIRVASFFLVREDSGEVLLREKAVVKNQRERITLLLNFRGKLDLLLRADPSVAEKGKVGLTIVKELES